MTTVDQAPAQVEALTDFHLVNEWEIWMIRSKGLSPNTRHLYLRTVQSAWGEIPDLPKASEETLQAWIQSKGGKPGTVNNRITALASFYRFLIKTKRRVGNPCDELDRPKIHKRLPKPVENLEAILVAADEMDVLANEKGVHPRRVGETRDMITFLCYTGLRIHEAHGCTWPVPCPEEAFVVGKGDKEELMEIFPKAREAWDRLGGKWPIGPRATQRRFEKIRTPEHPNGFHPHMCRHWRATSLVRAGAEIGVVSKIMRHSSVQTTMGYSAYAKRQMRECLNLVP